MHTKGRDRKRRGGWLGTVLLGVSLPLWAVTVVLGFGANTSGTTTITENPSERVTETSGGSALDPTVVLLGTALLMVLCVGWLFARRPARSRRADDGGGAGVIVRDGTRVGAYRVGELIGMGATGVVYHARHDALDRPVAIKLLAPALASDEHVRERLRREALSAARLDHPNVVAVFDAGEADGRAYIAMQLVVGRSLDELIGTPQLTAARMLEVVSMVAAGLDHAHERGVVHRDVKPQNIMVEGATGRALLADFGIAAAAGQDRLTSVGDLVGTVAYAAPEQLAGDAPARLVDIYGLGCVLFELLTGHVPYARKTLPAAIQAHRSAPVPAVSSYRRDLAHTGIDAVVRQALAKDPAERWQTAGALADAARVALDAAARPRPRAA